MIASVGGITVKIVTLRAKGIMRPILCRLFKISKT